MSSYITEQDVQNYGTELIDLTQRAAVQALSPHLQESSAAKCRAAAAPGAGGAVQLGPARGGSGAGLSTDRSRSALACVVAHTGSVEWATSPTAAGGRDRPLRPCSGRVIFRGWQQEASGADTGDAAQPRQQRSQRMPMWASDRRIYSRTEVARLYRQHAMGAYNGREAEWQRQEADIIAAGREGRIQNPEAVGVK
jgi:hypothetical protein